MWNLLNVNLTPMQEGMPFYVLISGYRNVDEISKGYVRDESNIQDAKTEAQQYRVEASKRSI
ncbi:hypothetical protein BBH88_15340 [Planococcus antarcticus DSM 14505]|uniref:Uncharacterized protein n=1 Tax=Planococcus antarcticus DSM 14505 TaxID=1185653 RepID=A0ABM6D7G7_9BACL|nr:hypothetical protein BBH88_15340 [Planococcus antarcticus DSM 14505]